MGRREKVGTARKEKIYTLRKKLDDFIEEDKKRRDRNIYILDRFEKMRSTVALLKSINNHIIIENENSDNHSITRNNDRVFMRQDILNYRKNHAEDGYILKEISKKYILIPRIYSNNRYPVIDIQQSEDLDWKRKYNILDELKKKEREEPPERDNTEHFIQKDSRLLNINSNNININSLPQDKETYNISKPYTNISSNLKVDDEATNSLLKSNDWKADSTIDKVLNEQNDYKPIHDSKQLENILNINKDSDSEYIKEEKIYISSKVPETNYTNIQCNSTEILKEYEVSKNGYEVNPEVLDEIHNGTESLQNNGVVNYCEDIDNDSSELILTILPESEIIKTDLDKYEKVQHESLYSEKISENMQNDQIHPDNAPDTYGNDNKCTNDPYNNYYEEPQLPQEQHNTFDNEEITQNHNQNYEQEHENSNQNQFHNDYNSQNENYEAHNNYPVENQTYEYQNVGQQNTEYINSNIISAESQEINENFNENEHIYAMDENGQEFDQLQQNYVDPSHDEIQKLYIDNSEVNPENNVNENMQDNTINQEETYNLEHEYNEQSQAETAQQFEVGHTSTQNESDNLQHDYNNSNFNEIYQDNQIIQEAAYDYAAQGQEIQQQDGLGYGEQNQDEFVHYDEGNGLNAQNEIDNLQEDYSNQNIHEVYQEESLQAQDILDNTQYDHTIQSNAIQNVKDPGISQENYEES